MESITGYSFEDVHSTGGTGSTGPGGGFWMKIQEQPEPCRSVTIPTSATNRDGLLGDMAPPFGQCSLRGRVPGVAMFGTIEGCGCQGGSAHARDASDRQRSAGG